MSDPNNPPPPGPAVPPVPPVPPSIANHPLMPDLAPPGATRAPSPYEALRPEEMPPPGAYAGQYYQQRPAEPYAHWGRRVGAWFLDLVILLPFYIPAIIGVVMVSNHAVTDPITHQTTSGPGAGPGYAIALISYFGAILFGTWNQVFRQGRRGASLGKQWMQIVLVSETDGRPIGAGMTFVRMIVHIVDGLPCYLGYFWPLWDEKRQTFADKIMKTAVLYLPPPSASSPYPGQYPPR